MKKKLFMKIQKCLIKVITEMVTLSPNMLNAKNGYLSITRQIAVFLFVTDRKECHQSNAMFVR